MVIHEPAGDGAHHSRFSPELHHDIAEALGHRLLCRDAAADAALRELTNRVCAEARVLGLPPERMLIEVKHLFAQHPISEQPQSEQRRQLFERFISGCIKSYFAAGEMP